MKALTSARKWWQKQRYQFYRPEYERLQNRLLNLMPISLVICFVPIAVLALIQKYSALSINFVYWLQVLAVLALCSVAALFASSITLRWVDEHEKKAKEVN